MEKQVKTISHSEGSRGRRLLYWCLQFFGWGSYFGYSEFWILSSGHRRLASVWPIIMLAHLFASHILRSIIRKRSWIHLPTRKLIPPLFAVFCLLAIGVQLIVTPVAVAAHVVTLREQIESSWFYALFSIVLFAIWSLLYFAFQYSFLYRDSEVHRLRLEANLREVELRALKAQVNPHFLFNCLNNVRSLVAEDGERAREMLLQLSDLLRHALDAGRHERVPLSEELRVVRAYLDLEKLQHEERLRWLLDVSPDAMQTTVPPMLLQQLVENAVKHGVAGAPRGGEVAITARINVDRLSLRVENTGQLSPTPGNGVGLANARERLRLLCGPDAMLTLENADTTHVVATATVPISSL